MNIIKERTLNQPHTCERGRSMRNWRNGFLSGLVLVLAIMPMTTAFAASSVTAIDHASTGDGGVEISLQTSGDVPKVSVFATESPARIVLDLTDTNSQVDSESVHVGLGNVQQYSAVDAGGRTRLVVELSQAATYEYNAESGVVVLTIAGNGTVAQTASAALQSERVRTSRLQ